MRGYLMVAGICWKSYPNPKKRQHVPRFRSQASEVSLAVIRRRCRPERADVLGGNMQKFLYLAGLVLLCASAGFAQTGVISGVVYGAGNEPESSFLLQI